FLKLSVGRQFDGCAIFCARQHAVFLARNIDKLVEEEITQHKRGRECCEENRKPLIRSRSRLLIEATIRPFSRGWSITGMLFRHRCALRLRSRPTYSRRCDLCRQIACKSLRPSPGVETGASEALFSRVS